MERQKLALDKNISDLDRLMLMLDSGAEQIS